MSEIVDCISFIIQKTFSTLGVFLKFVSLRLLDLVGLIFNILACMTIYRLPYMVMLFKDLDSFWEWRYVGFVQLLIFLSDLPVLLGGTIVVLTIWRCFPLIKELRERECEWDFQSSSSFYYSGWKPRAIILKHFFLIFVDIIFVPAGLICLLSWRCTIFIKKMKTAETDWKRRKECFTQLLQLFVDIPCILLFFVTALTWRLPFLIRDVRKLRKEEGWNEVRWLSFKHFALIFLDLPCLICLVICTVTWRCPFVWRRLLKCDFYKKQKKMRRIVVEETGLLFCDIPCILCALFVTITLFRFSFLLRKFRNSYKNGKVDQWKVRIASVRQAGIVFVDVGCFMMSAVLVLTLWRAYPLIRDIRKRVARWRKGGIEKDKESEQEQTIVDSLKDIPVDEGSKARSENQTVEGRGDEVAVQIVGSTEPSATGPSEEISSTVKDQMDDENTENDTDKGVNDSLKLDESEITEAQNETELTSLSLVTEEDHGDDIAGAEITHVDEQSVDTATSVTMGAKRNQSDSEPKLDELNVNSSQTSESGADSELPGVSVKGNSTDGVTSDVIEESRERQESTISSICRYESVPGEETTDDAGNTSSLPPQKQEKIGFPGWKIRKDISKHFVMLLIDIPAIALVAVLLVTIIKVPRLMSTFIQSGDFYLEFAVTVYHLTLQLFIDIAFLLLFLLLALLRPLTTFVHVFEDEDHKKYRLLLFYRQWLPDILNERKKLFEEMDELLSVDLKMNRNEQDFLTDVYEIFDPYVDKLNWVATKLKDNELDPDFMHVLNLFIFWERKRPHKLVRRYHCEYVYIHRPDPLLRKENLFKCHREMLMYESSVRDAEKSLREFEAMKVPLWTHKNGYSSRSRKETQRVLLNCLPRGSFFILIVGLLCCLPIYRAPSLVKRLWRRWYDRANIVLLTVKEYGLDFLAILNILLVLILVYRAPFLILDLLADIVQKKSWKAARKTAFNYPPMILEDIADMLRILASWRTPKFLLTAFLFGLLMPADLFLTVAKLLTSINALAYLASVGLYVIFVGFPFFHVFYLGPKFIEDNQGWINIPVLSSFLTVFLLLLLLMVASSVRKSRSQYSLKPDVCDYVHFNWFNIHTILFELLEFLQLVALVFSIRNIPMYASTNLHEMSHYLLMSFIPFEAKFWISFVLFWIWFLLSGAPIIFEQILEDLPKNSCAKHSGWRLAISFFANTLFVTLFESFSSSFGCLYPSCTIATNVTCVSALVEDQTYQCWSSPHTLYALFGLLALIWYSSTALIFSSQYGDTEISKLDVSFSPLYNVIVNLTKGIIVVATVVITRSHFVLLAILVACFVFLVVFTLLFEVIFKYPVCNLPSFLVWRVASFISCVLGTIMVIVAFAIGTSGNKVPIFTFGVGLFIILIVSIIFTIRLRRPSDVIAARDDFCRQVLNIEAKLYKNGSMLSSWSKRRKRWIRMVRSVRESRKNDAIYDQSSWSHLEIPVQQPDQSVQPNPPEPTVATSSTSQDRRDGEEGESSVPLPPPPSYDTEKGKSNINMPPPPAYNVAAASTHESDEEEAPPPILSVITTGRNNITTPPYGYPLVLMKHTGVNLLLVFEQSIQYLTFNYSFLAQRETWLSAVVNSNWTGLLHCLKVLEGSLGNGFASPSRLDMALARKPLPTDTLENDPEDDVEPPTYTPEPRDLETITRISQSLREEAIANFASIETYGEPWSQLLNKILPTLPVIRLWTFENIDGAVTFSMKLRRPLSGTITAVGPNGIKLARGASIVLGKEIEGMLCAYRLTFTGKHQPKGKKGPVQVTVQEISLTKKKHQWYLESEGKSLKLSKALDTLGEIEWK